MNPSVTSTSDKPHRRALPGWAVDLITDGVGPQRSSRDRDMAVRHALRRTAISAQVHGWPVTDWLSQVLDHADQHVLGAQARVWEGKRQPPSYIERRLRKIWDEAAADPDLHKPWTDAERAHVVTVTSASLRNAAADPDRPLRDAERLVLLDVAAQMQARAMTRVAMPWRPVAERTGLDGNAAKRALQSLCRKQVLVLARRGEPRREGRPGRANLYEAGVIHKPGGTAYGSVSRTTYGSPAETACDTAPLTPAGW